MSKNVQLASLINYISVDGSGNVVLSTGQLVATQNYVTTAVSNLVASAPSTLDTLNELATALGNDANFATTVATSIGTKLNLSGGTLTGALNGTSAFFTDNLRTDTGLGLKYGSFVSTTGYLNLFSARVGSTFTINFKDGTGGFESALSFTNSANRNYTFPNADGTIALTSNLSSYLPLTGGTLTGALGGTSATFSGNLFFSTGSRSGGVGIGTSTIQTSNVDSNILQFYNNGFIQNIVGNQMMVSNNAYLGTGGWTYANTAPACAIRFGAQAAGDISFHNAPSGTAGTTISNWDTSGIKMYITPSGNVGINTITPNKNSIGRALTVNASSGTSMYELCVGDTTTTAYWEFTGTNSSIINIANGFLRLGTNNNEWLRITNLGNLTLNRTNVPSGLVQEVTGDTPLLGLDVNFRPGALINTSFAGAQVRVDMRSGQPPFSFLYRPAGSTTDSLLASVREDGIRFKNGGTSLNYYEEGNWTPQLYWGNGGQYNMNASNAGRYVRVGNLVHLQFQLMWGSYNGGASGGTLRVGGIPFSAGGSSRSAGSICANNSIILSSGFTWIGLTIDPNANFIYIIQNLPGGGYSHDPGVSSSGIVYSLTITYSLS
jgi:hypothetical protein